MVAERWRAGPTPTAHGDAYVEFLHLARPPHGWWIVNALWRYADGHGPLG